MLVAETPGFGGMRHVGGELSPTCAREVGPELPGEKRRVSEEDASGRHGAILDGEDLRAVWQKITERYESLPVGVRPSIFDPDEWLQMCKIAEERLATRHSCD